MQAYCTLSRSCFLRSDPVVIDRKKAAFFTDDPEICHLAQSISWRTGHAGYMDGTPKLVWAHSDCGWHDQDPAFKNSLCRDSWMLEGLGKGKRVIPSIIPEVLCEVGLRVHSDESFTGASRADGVRCASGKDDGERAGLIFSRGSQGLSTPTSACRDKRI